MTMKKIYMAIHIIAITISPAFIASCAALDDLARLGASQIDEGARQFPKIKSVVPPATKNINQNTLAAKCNRQVGKSAVVEAWKRANSSGSQVHKNYLLDVARDAIQKCTVGSVGDKILDNLDNLANSAVTDFEKEYPQAQVK